MRVGAEGLGVAENHQAFDEAPDGSHARETGQDKLRDAHAVVAQVEAVDAEAAEENSEQPGGDAGFLRPVTRTLRCMAELGMAVALGLLVAGGRVTLDGIPLGLVR
nr:hypothetical protein [Arthrobacter sp. zg-Y895]